MHELSIAKSVVRIAGRQADGRRVTRVQMKVGHLRQVVPSSLAFGFELLAEGTPVEGAERWRGRSRDYWRDPRGAGADGSDALAVRGTRMIDMLVGDPLPRIC